MGGLVEAVSQQHPGKARNHIGLDEFQADPQDRAPPGPGQSPAFPPGIQQGPQPAIDAEVSRQEEKQYNTHRQGQFSIDYRNINNPVQHEQVLRQPVAVPQNKRLAASHSLQSPQQGNETDPQKKGQIEFWQRRRQHEAGSCHCQEFNNHVAVVPFPKLFNEPVS